VLDAIRNSDPQPSLLYTSTNKVYGALSDVSLRAVDDGYVPEQPELRERGMDETRPLDFYSPYGCSKGCADQYVLDHARIYGLRAVVFRMSCIYGPHQCGTEDQGWVAHFLLRTLAGQPITLYGDGLQVRDALYVDDLVHAMGLAAERLESSPEDVSGRAFNIGGGPGNAISIRGLLAQIAACTRRVPQLRRGPWRPGDQRYYVSNVERFGRIVGWRPNTSVEAGLQNMLRWMSAPGPAASDVQPRAPALMAIEGAGTP
jgi:CDP-paratose 2-epimerase